MKNLVVAIDGPAGAGKSTIAKIIAQRSEYFTTPLYDTLSPYSTSATPHENAALAVFESVFPL